MSIIPVSTKRLNERTVAVWDPVVRYGHWALVLAFAAAYLSGEEEAGGADALHVWSGYIVGVIVAVRVVWGFIGPRYARFSDFIYGPAQIVRYLNDLVRGRGRRYLGHSPAGGAMVIALLVCLTGTVGTGLVAYGQAGKGPLAAVVPAIVTPSHADEDGHGASLPSPATRDAASAALAESEREGGTVGELHDLFANVTLALAVLHVLGVGLASFMHRESLVKAMIFGTKRAED
ncbi:MAG: cytochrome B [Rhodospirillales bacterium 20-64-7]|nr:MAG: cytochrome B [Rhodospirillales bacterium 20-64-7]HQT76984.1 cytochrome b/b6 domain-containing protein [Rhodopila sp.]